jgi:DNA-binding NtrC family response regulator
MNGKIPVTLLYVEDEEMIREAVTVFLELHCAKVVTAADGFGALRMFKEHRPDLVLTDILMPRMDGMQLAARLREENPLLPIIITTAFSETAHLLRAIELRVAGFIRKPLDYDDLIRAIRNATLPLVQEREIECLKREKSHAFFSANGLELARVAEQIAQVAEGGYSVLIHGEKGTGKSRAAKAIHSLSRRRKLPFVQVSCGEMSAEQLELELFGRARGTLGCFAAARGGTVLLQNVANAPMQTQAKLLRFMEEGSIAQVCGKGRVACDVRVLATVTGDPRQAVAERRLLEGLYFMLNDLSLQMPALREMPEEIPALAQLFLAEGAEDAGRSVPQLSEGALRLLAKLTWPGNIRELKNLMRRSVLHADRVVTEAVLQPLLRKGAASPLPLAAETPPSLTLEEVECWAITQALVASKGRKLQAAATLGIDYKRLQRKLIRYGLR